jgi:hypothetical protein
MLLKRMAPTQRALATAVPEVAAVMHWQAGLVMLAALCVTYAYQLLIETKRQRLLLDLARDMRRDMVISQEQSRGGGGSLRITCGPSGSSDEPDGR